MNPTRASGAAAWVAPGVLACVMAVGAGCASLASGALGAAFGNTNPLAPVLPPGGRYVSGGSADTAGIKVRALRIRSDVSSDSIEISLATSQAGEGDPSPVFRRALVAPPTVPPCTAGWMAESVWLANQQRWDRPLPLADPLDLNFPLPREYLREPFVLDLTIDDGTGSHCKRLPLGSPDQDGMTREARSSGGGGFGLNYGRSVRTAAGTAIRDTPYGVMFMSSLGRWFGGWRLGGRLEACIGGCGAGAFITLPVVAVLERMLHRGRVATIAASVGYEVGRIEDAINGFRGEATWAHGPRVSFLVLGPRPFVGANPGEGFSARGFEVSVQRQFFTVGISSKEPPTWILGLALVAL